jgi:pimeloyl-ACP methyl ester carboxylesterase
MDPRAIWRAPELGTPRELDLPQGRLRVFEAGSGPPLVFVHGLLVNGNLWRKVVPRLDGLRTVVLDLPLGSHTLPMPAEAELTAPAIADLIADAIEALELDEVTLVGNDTGGALCQMVVTRRPERIGRLVLTPCDYRDNFPPKLFAYFKPAAAIPGGIPMLLAPMRLGPPRRLPIAFGFLTKRRIDRQAEDSYVYPALSDGAVRADLRKVIKGIDKKDSNEAADRLHEFDMPALIAWAREDRLFSTRDANSLAADLPDSRLEWIDDSFSFVSEDRPERLAKLVGDFARESQRART